MKRLIQRTSMGALALVSIGTFACGDADGTTLGFGDDLSLDGNGGSSDDGTAGTDDGSAGTDDGPSQGGSAGSDGTSGGAGGSAAGAGGSSAGTGGTGGTDSGGTGGTDSGGTGGTDSGGTGGTDSGGTGGTGGGDPLNLLLNPDFEAGISGWSAAFGGSLSASTAQAHGGSQSALVSGRTASYQGAHANVTSLVEAGATYTISAFARISGATSDAISMTARVRCDGLADQYVPINSGTGSDSSWTELSGDLALPASVDCFLNEVLVYVEGPAAGVDLYVDDARMVLTTEAPAFGNLITNSDFEAGITDWTAAFGGSLAATTTLAHGGLQSAVVTGRTGTYQGAHFDLTGSVDMGATYSFRAFARLGGAASDSVNLTARLSCDGQSDQYIPIDSLTASDSAWSQLSGELVLPSALECFPTSLLVYVEGPAAGVDLYVDDVIGFESAPAPATGNLIANPDFEAGVTGWSAAFGGNLSVSTDPVHGGQQSAVVTGRVGTYQGAHVDLTNLVEQGATYSFNAYTRVAGAASDTVNLTARLKCEGLADQYIPIDTLTATDAGWSHLSGDLTLPAEFACFMTELLVYAEGPAAGVDLYLDDVYGIESAPAPVIENLFTNSDFESGVTGWTAAFGGSLAASTAQAHSGTQSAVVSNRTGTYQGAFVDLTSLVEPGATYSFSTFARLGGASSGPLNLTARIMCDGQADQYFQVDTTTGSDAAWSLLSGNLVVPHTYQCALSSVLVYVEGAPVGVDIYVDDAWAVEAAPAPVVENLIGNSDFEGGITGWTAAFGGSISASTDQAHGGAQSAVVSNRTGTYQGAFVDLTSLVEPGSTYAFSAFARLGVVSSGAVNLTALIQCASLGDQYVQLDTLTGSDSAWSLLSGNLAVPSEGACTLTSLLVYVEGAPVGADIYVDDVWSVLAAP